MKLLNALMFLTLVQVCEAVVFSWLWELHPIQNDSTNITSTNLSTTSETQRRHCRKDRHCGTGYCHRHYRTCHKCKTDGRKCRRDHVCCKGFECVFGSCRKVVKSGNYMSRCRKDKDCKKGLCCAKSHGEFVCKPMLQRNQICAFLEGGVAYTVNHGCPCDEGMACKKVTLQRKRIKGSIAPRQRVKIRRCQKIDS